MELTPIGHIHTGYPNKFGVPRQSGIIDAPGYITFDAPYNDANAFRGLEEYDRIWLLWIASENMNAEGTWDWHPTVRPPRLGGNERKGVFAVRSPNHPNAIGLSCVKLLGVHLDGSWNGVAGPVLEISGMDVVDGTPLVDIKPYVPFADSFPNARCSFALPPVDDRVNVTLAEELCKKLGQDNVIITAENITLSDSLIAKDAFMTQDDLRIIIEMVNKDPRPRYQDDSRRVYGMYYKDYNVKFIIDEGNATILDIEKETHQ